MKLQTDTAVIANGASESGVLDVREKRVKAIQMPTAWTAAVLTFLAFNESTGSFQKVVDDAGNEISFAVTASTYIILEQLGMDGLAFVKLRSGTAALPVNQGAARTIIVHSEPRT